MNRLLLQLDDRLELIQERGDQVPEGLDLLRLLRGLELVLLGAGLCLLSLFLVLGAGQFVVKLDDGYLAASDPRRDGQAAGF